MDLETHRVHLSLLRPPLFMGLERRLFFVIAAGVGPIVAYGSLSLPTLAILAVYLTLSFAVAARLTALDQDLLSLLLASLRYRDHYHPLPSPGSPGQRPLGLNP